MATTSRFVTDEELLQAPRDGQKYERVDGEMRVSPAGGRHEAVVVELTGRLWAFVTERVLGRNPDRLDNIRSPDVSFVAAGRFADGRPPVGFIGFAPDLAVEVLSPSDRRGDVLEKVGEYLDRHAPRVGDRSGEANGCSSPEPYGSSRDR